MKLDSELFNTPVLGEDIYAQLPHPLHQLRNLYDNPRENDNTLISICGALSGLFPNLSGIYDDRSYSCNLNTFIIAPPASGKGVMMNAWYAIQKINSYFRINSEQENSDGSSRSLIIPGNSSSSAMCSMLSRNNGAGVIFETESDTLENSLSKEWGDFSDIIRRSFHNEPISQLRMDQSNNFAIPYPTFSTVLSGTPDQFFKLISSANNGFFSRFLFYSYHSVTGWRDVRPKKEEKSKQSIFEDWASYFLELYKSSEDIGVEFEMGDHQWDKLNSTYEEYVQFFLLNDIDNGMSLAFRHGLMTFKLAMLFTLLRSFEPGVKYPIKIISSDHDFNCALSITTTLIHHAWLLFRNLSDSNVSYLQPISKKVFELFEPNREYQRKDLIACGKELNIPERTFDDHLRKLCVAGVLQKSKNGIYSIAS